MIITEENYLAHYGTPRHSGRYPWGSGVDVEGLPRNASLLDYVNHLHKQGVKESEIAAGMGISTTQLRAKKSIAKNEKKVERVAQAQKLKNKGLSNPEIAKAMGEKGESSVRALLAAGAKDNADILFKTADMLKNEVDNRGIVDVGRGVESHLNMSAEKLNNAVAILQEQGYTKHVVPIRQVTTGHDTETKVLCPPGTTQRQAWEQRDSIKQLSIVSNDGGRTFGHIDHAPISIHPNRVEVKYKEDGGGKADGMIFVRDGVPDVSLGGKRYAQVRVQVGEGHYLKGMAMYKEGLPPGVDLQFHTNKEKSGNKLDAMKPMKEEPLPFGAVVRQILADEGTPHERNTSAMNIVYDEGKWATWSKNLSSQFLSKQKPGLAKAQLDMAYERRKQALDEINALTNPVIKKKLLNTLSEAADASAVHLEAAAISRRDSWHAILPLSSIAPNEVYAPNYRNGEKVVLIRYPHGGTFELPELKVNNNNREGMRNIGPDVRDAVGIHHSVASHLSGADFDGDTVFVVPNPRGKITHTKALEELKNFDPIASYKDDSIPPISSGRKQQEMGLVSNLITDMTIRGAPHQEIARAVRHSMVVIDAEKHGLNIKRSAIDNGIAKLKDEYQSNKGSTSRGASTIISRAESKKYVPQRKPRPQPQGGPINPVTGRKEYIPTGAMRKTSKGLVPKLEPSTKLAETTDAFTLISEANTPMERLYAEHSNKLKALANEARLSYLKTPRLLVSRSAKKVHAKEVASLDSKLNIAKRNAPLERQAQIIANATSRAKRVSNPNITREQRKKMEYKDLETARARLGAGKKQRRIDITPEEWNAIQAGAITNHKLEQIIANADLEQVRKLATPRREVLMTSAKTKRAQGMLASGYTRQQVADALGVSLTTLDNSMK